MQLPSLLVALAVLVLALIALAMVLRAPVSRCRPSGTRCAASSDVIANRQQARLACSEMSGPLVTSAT